MWRTTEHKLILCFDRKSDPAAYSLSDIKTGELYDLTADPAEWDNLYDKEGSREIREKMSAELVRHLKTL
jgi:hypothetical protein